MEAINALQTEKPTPNRRTVVTARDAETGKSKSVTVYEASPEQVIETIKNLGKQRRKQTAA